MGLPASSYQNMIFDNHLQNLGQQGWREPKSGTCGPLWHEAHGRGRCWGGQTRGVLTSLTLPIQNSFLDITCKTLRSFLNRWRSPGWRWALWDQEELPLQAMTMRLAAVRAGEIVLFLLLSQLLFVVVTTIVCCCQKFFVVVVTAIVIVIVSTKWPRSMFQGGCSRPGLLGSSWHFWMSSSGSSCGSGVSWCRCLKRIHKNELPAIWQYFASCLHVDYLKSQSHI